MQKKNLTLTDLTLTDFNLKLQYLRWCGMDKQGNMYVNGTKLRLQT